MLLLYFRFELSVGTIISVILLLAGVLTLSWICKCPKPHFKLVKTKTETVVKTWNRKPGNNHWALYKLPTTQSYKILGSDPENPDFEHFQLPAELKIYAIAHI